MNKKKAFSLVELMLVVAITAIISAVAIPSYKDYVNRSKVSAMISLIDPCQTQIYQYFLKNGALPDGASAGQTVSCQGVDSLPIGTNPPTTPNLSDKVSASYTYQAVDPQNPTTTPAYSQFNINHSDLHPTGQNSVIAKMYVRLTATGGDLTYICGTFSSNAMPTTLIPATCNGPII